MSLIAVNRLRVQRRPIVGNLPITQVKGVGGGLPLAEAPSSDGTVAARVGGGARIAAGELRRQGLAVNVLVVGAEGLDSLADGAAAGVERSRAIGAGCLGGLELDGVTRAAEGGSGQGEDGEGGGEELHV